MRVPYFNFNDYAENDPEYLLRVLENRLHDYQGEIQFLDGTSYFVTAKMRYWTRDGDLHRVGGPALDLDNKRKEWWQNGKRHREDGPAIEYQNGDKEWFLNGNQLSEKDYYDKIQKL